MAEEIERDIRADEAWKGNIKRTYDAYQDLDLQAARRFLELSTQALANSVTTSHALNQQTLRHEALAADRQWNVNEDSYVTDSILGNKTAQDAIEALIAAKVQEALDAQG